MLAQKINKDQLYGLVLAGGHSIRMNKDKSLIKYHGQSQVKYCFNLLSRVCSKVFISNRKEQGNIDEHKQFPQIHDTYLENGPLSGILSSMKAYPHVAWVVLACDLPFVNNTTIEILIKQRDSLAMATVYKSTNDPHLPEPLCAIYEPEIFDQLLKYVKKGVFCPRKILMNLDVNLIEQNQTHALDNINELKDYKRAVELIKVNRNEQGINENN